MEQMNSTNEPREGEGLRPKDWMERFAEGLNMASPGQTVQLEDGRFVHYWERKKPEHGEDGKDGQ